MTERPQDAGIVRQLAALRSGAPGKRGPALARRRPVRATTARVVLARSGSRDPLTGQRGAGEGEQLVASVGHGLIVVQLERQHDGLAARGQVVARQPGLDVRGGLVHLRLQGAVRIAPLDAHGEFFVEGLGDAKVESVQVELDDEVWTVAWPELRP